MHSVALDAINVVSIRFVVYRLNRVEISTWGKWVYKSAIEDPPFLLKNGCDSSPFDPQSILIKDHFMGTAQILFQIPICLFYLNNGCL